jgi:hypothetical protein
LALCFTNLFTNCLSVPLINPFFSIIDILGQVRELSYVLYSKPTLFVDLLHVV